MRPVKESRFLSRGKAFLFGSAVFTLVAFSSTRLTAQPGMTMSLDGESLSVTGVTPGASVALFGLAHKTEDFHTRLERVLEVVDDADSDGAVQIIQSSLTIPTSVWVAVDLSAGAFVSMAGVPEFDPAPIATPQAQLNSTGTQAIGLRLLDRSAVEALWIRPGVGYWEVSAADGGAGEAIGDPDGVLDLACQVFADNPEHTDPPEGLRIKDVLVLVDPLTLEWSLKTGADLGLPEEQ